jgi:hypothetical protein
VGKTRLAAELTARCAADRTKVLTGGCVPVGGDGLPFAPIMEALRPLPEEFGADTVREFAGPSWRELARLLPALGEPEAGPAGQVAQVRLFELLLGLLARLSEQTPVALVVEDLHWADQSTRDLLALLVRNLRRERVLLVVSYRSDEPVWVWLGSFLAGLDRGGPVQRLELSRLDRAETVAQSAGILKAAPPAEQPSSLAGTSRHGVEVRAMNTFAAKQLRSGCCAVDRRKAGGAEKGTGGSTIAHRPWGTSLAARLVMAWDPATPLQASETMSKALLRQSVDPDSMRVERPVVSSHLLQQAAGAPRHVAQPIALEPNVRENVPQVPILRLPFREAQIRPGHTGSAASQAQRVPHRAYEAGRSL